MPLQEGAARRRGAPRTGPDTLTYKEDWPAARQRFLALWEGEIIDRACIAVSAPRPGAPPVPAPASWEAKYADVDYTLAATHARLAGTYFGGEAFPVADTFLGYAGWGGEPQFAEDTIWVRPMIRDWEKPYRFDPENLWLRRFVEITWALIDDGHRRGRYLVDTDGMHPSMDALVFLRGSQNLCLDVLEHSAEIQTTLREIMAGFQRTFDERFGRIPAGHGFASGAMWAPGRFGMTCSDFSAMIGPKHFAQLVLPDIEEIAGSLDYCYYHLDGPCALHHVPALLEIKDIDAIQWVQGAGERVASSATKWIPLARQVQAAGKVMQMDCKCGEVEELLRELDPRRLLLLTQAPSIEAAEELLRKAYALELPAALTPGAAMHKAHAGGFSCPTN